MSDPVQSIQSRILEIQQRFNQLQPVVTTTSTNSSGDFAATLQAAVASGGDISSFANGKIPDSALVSIGGGEKLAPKAASAFTMMRADAQRAGINIGINDSYRSYDEQVEMARTKGIYGKGGLAAVPGHSNHGKGLSVDLELNSQAQTWMRNNAGKYGFVNDVKGESWHWTYKG